MKKFFIYFNKKIFGPYDNPPTQEQIEYMKKVFPIVNKYIPDSDHIFNNSVPPADEVYILEINKDSRHLKAAEWKGKHFDYVTELENENG